MTPKSAKNESAEQNELKLVDATNEPGDGAAVVPAVGGLADLPFDLSALVPGGLPALMGDAMNSSGAEYEPDLGGQGGPKLPYISFPQANSRKYKRGMLGRMWLGAKGDDIQEARHYPETISFLLVDSLVDHSKGRGKGVGGRLMWQTNDDGTRDLEKGVLCQSANGIAPMPRYMGLEFTDYRTGERVKIGYTRDQQTGKHVPMDSINICASCPASQWITLKNGKPIQLCKSNWVWIVASIDGDNAELVKVSGGNSGVQMALEGRQQNANGSRHDKAALPGIEYFFRERNEKREVVLPATFSFSDAQFRLVTGLVFDNNGTDVRVPAQAMVKQDKEWTRNEAFFTLLPKAKAVVLNVPTFPFAPEGKPEHVGRYVPVYPVVMSVTENNFNPATFVPDFALAEKPLTEAQYNAFLAQKARYAEEGMRDYFLGTALLEDVAARLRESAPPLISPVPAPALPSVAVTTTDVVEAEVITADDSVPFDA